MENLLNAINFTDFFMLETGYEVGIDALGMFAKAVIEGIGIIGLGIIVFALVLKAIVLPFDIYQRVKMRKQTLIMREMKPELEKLQKQYANDKAMYNQKMMELYKKNGYSMLGACLPMIISMVILIIAFQGFRSYSDQANLKMYVEMSEVYNRAVSEYVVEGKDYHLCDDPEQADELTFTPEDWENATHTEDGIVYTYFTVTVGEEQVPHLRVESEDAHKCIYYEYDLLGNKAGTKNYKIDKDKLKDLDDGNGGKAGDAISAAMESAGISEDVACRNYLIKPGGLAVKKWYEEEKGGKPAGFLWIKNVWQSDVTFRQPIQNWEGFSGTFGNFTVTYTAESGKEGAQAPFSAVWDSGKYNALISEIKDHAGDYNGYYILVILSIGLMVLSQFISMRSNKESNKYQTVDGSGAKTQKIMMVMLPLIYAVFAFMYSAAFSLYMVMSSFISILVTLLSNLIIGRIFRKKEEAAIVEKRTRTLPWMKQEQNNKGKKDKKGRK